MSEYGSKNGELQSPLFRHLAIPCQVTCKLVWIFNSKAQHFVANGRKYEAERLVVCVIHEKCIYGTIPSRTEMYVVCMLSGER
jgi:hypothetical protein